MDDLGVDVDGDDMGWLRGESGGSDERALPVRGVDVMTADPITFTPETTGHEGAQTLAEQRISGAAVVNAEGGIAGIVSEYDLIARTGTTVRDVMTPRPETIGHDEDLATAAAKMRDLDVGVLPVMAGGQVAGIITDRDLAMAMAGGDGQLSALRIEDLMSSVPVTIGPDATLQEATELMAGNQIRRLLVVDGTDLTGILSLGDLAVEGAEHHAETALEEISEPSEPRR